MGAKSAAIFAVFFHLQLETRAQDLSTACTSCRLTVNNPFRLQRKGLRSVFLVFVVAHHSWNPRRFMISIEQTPAETRPDQILSRPSTVVSMHGEGTEPERPRGCLQCIHGTDTYLPTYLPNLPVMSGAWDATGRKRCNTCPSTTAAAHEEGSALMPCLQSTRPVCRTPYSVFRGPFPDSSRTLQPRNLINFRADLCQV